MSNIFDTEGSASSDSSRRRFTWRPFAIGGGIFTLVAAIVALVVFKVVIPANVTSEGNKIQNTLMQDYGTGEAKLHECKSSIAGAANVAKAEADALDKILDDTLNGKFGTSTEAGGQGLNQGAFIAALRTVYPVSLYPDTSALSRIFDKVLAKVNDCYGEYQAVQVTVQVDVKNLRNFRNGSWTHRHFGGSNFPSDDLVWTVGNQTVTGAAALTNFARPITDSQTEGAYQSGRDDGSLNGPFGTPTASPTAR